MWSGERSDYIHFTPMSLRRAQNAAKKGFSNEMEMLEYQELWPKLTRSDVSVYANDEKISVLSFQEVDDFLVEINGKAYTRPSYILSIPKGYEGQVIKIELASLVNDGESRTTEYGEGYYFW